MILNAQPYLPNQQQATNTPQTPVNSAAATDDNQIPYYDVPITLSLLVSNSLYPDIYSPVGVLIIPFYRRIIPYGYLIVVGVEMFAAMVLKWLANHSSGYGPVSVGFNQELPNLEAASYLLRSRYTSNSNSYQQPSSPPSQPSSQRPSPQAAPPQNSLFQQRVNLFRNPQSDREFIQQEFQSPLLPTEGLTINLTLSAPVTSMGSVVGTAFSYKLKAINDAPGWLIPVTLVILYIVLGPYFKERIARGEE